MEVDRTKILDLLTRLSEEHNAESWQEKGIHVWPLIRHKLAWELMRVKGKQDRFLGSKLSKRLHLVLRGIRELFVFIRVKKRIPIVFLSKSTYRVLHDGVFYDKFCDSISILSKDKLGSRATAIIESGVDFGYRRPIPPEGNVFEVQGMLFLLRIWADIKSQFRAPFNFSYYKAFKRELEENTGIQIRLSDKALNKYLQRTLLQAQIFADFLRRCDVKIMMSVCYYEDFGYAMNIACRRYGVLTVDIQHGVQGKYHPAYAPFPRIPERGFEMLPEVFWVWNDQSARNIANWNTPLHRPVLGGNPWVEFFHDRLPEVTQDVNDVNIIVSLQPVDDALPNFLLEAIQKTIERYKWNIRLHPRQFEDKKDLMATLAAYGLADKVEVESSTTLPLPVVLKRSRLHITQWSSVVIEAFEMGIPSVLIHKNGELIYPAGDFDGLVAYAYSVDDLIKAVERLICVKGSGELPVGASKVMEELLLF